MSGTFLVELPNGPSWDAARELREQRLWDEHAAFVDRLGERGAIQFAGRLTDGSGALTVFEVESADEVRRLLADDPWLDEGILRVGGIRAWELYLDARQNGRPPAGPGRPAFVVERPAGPAWIPGRGPREQPLWDEHAAYMDAIYERGGIVLAGPLVDEAGAVLVLEAEGEDEARGLLARDPWIVDADILRVGRVRGWRILLDPTEPVNVLELRQYTLKPGARDTLIELFDREFVESQEAHGMRVVGQFRDLDRPDRFVWLRAFDDLASRAPALTAFYTSPIWRQHSAEANATMLDSSDVLLLRPAGPGSGFELGGLERPPPGAAAADDGLVLATICNLDAPLEEIEPAPLATYVTEPAPNDFPALPVREGENVVVWFSRDPVQPPASLGEPQILRLAPTARSLLR